MKYQNKEIFEIIIMNNISHLPTEQQIELTKESIKTRKSYGIIQVILLNLMA
jgi:hypothetical protein